jgi:hypothetical protein
MDSKALIRIGAINSIILSKIGDLVSSILIASPVFIKINSFDSIKKMLNP